MRVRMDGQMIPEGTMLLGSPVQLLPTPLIIGGPTVSSITTTSANVAWECNQFVQGFVEYGLDEEYGSETTPELSFDYTVLSADITGLTTGTEYHYRVRGQNEFGVQYYSDDDSFTTA